MTDRFEEAVREAALGLAVESSEPPSYHDAWQRGRRRRLIKRSALGVAGAVALVAALTVNLGQLPGSERTETDDVALPVEAATAEPSPIPVVTTDPLPVQPPPEDPDAASQGSAAFSAPATEPRPSSTPTPPATESADTGAAPADDAATEPETQATIEAVPPTAVPPVPTATPAPAPPTATPVPPTPVPPTPTPTPTRVPFIPPDESNPDPSDSSASNDSGSAAGTEQALTTDDPATDTLPEVAATTDEAGTTAIDPNETGVAPERLFNPELGGVPDASLSEPATDADQARCDVDGDRVPDATCSLLRDYACTGEGAALPGYSAVDTNADGVADTCTASGTTTCDTTGNGQSDTFCVIELDPVTETPPGETPPAEGAIDE